jgi:AAA domain
MKTKPAHAAPSTVLLIPDTVVELRIPIHDKRVVSGFFDDQDKLIEATRQWDGRAPALYWTLNPVDPKLLGRVYNRLEDYSKQTTTDKDIVRRTWLPLDFDVANPAGISSSDAEHDAALTRARDCLAWLLSLGFSSYVLADSGNGAHITLRIELPNDDASTLLIQQCVQAVAFRFTGGGVTVDETVFNAARLWKAYNTWACKGDDTPERPHRQARVLETAPQRVPEPRALLEMLASFCPPEPDSEPRSGRPKQHAKTTGPAFDLEHWIAEHQLEVSGPDPWNGGRKWIFAVCPWNPAHTNRSAGIFQLPNGAIGARCHHNGCTGKDWHALRDLVEPGWRERRPAGGSGPDWSDLDATAPTALRWYTVAELREETGTAIQYLVDGLFAESSLSVIAGKVAIGKSTLARMLMYCVARGLPFLGKETKLGPVLYIAPEESKHGVMADLAAIGFTDEDPIHLCFTSSTRVVADVLAKLEETTAVLVIFETIFRVLRIKDVGDYAQATLALNPILALARKTSAHVMFTHHCGKQERIDDLDAILGSAAIGGTPDTRIVLKRKGELRTIVSVQRYGTPIPETLLEFDPETKHIRIGRPKAEHDENLVREAILECLKAQEEDQEKGHPLTEAEIQEEVEGRTLLKKRVLRRLVEEGKVFRQRKFPDKQTTRGNPYIYARMLGPEYMREHGTQHEKEDLNARKDSPHAWSGDFGNFENSAKTRDPASRTQICPKCQRPDCTQSRFGWYCNISQEDRDRLANDDRQAAVAEDAREEPDDAPDDWDDDQAAVADDSREDIDAMSDNEQAAWEAGLDPQPPPTEPVPDRDFQPSQCPPPGAAERKQRCDDVIDQWRRQEFVPPVSGHEGPADGPVESYLFTVVGDRAPNPPKFLDRDKVADLVRDPQAFAAYYAEKCNLGRCPHCHETTCWKSPRGWLCSLPSVLTPLIAKPKKKKQKEPRS